MKKSPNYLSKKLKNNSRAFVILCNNCRFFYSFCKWFPKDFFDDYDFYVVFDNRVGNIQAELETIIDSTDNLYIKKFNVINGDEILEFYKEELQFASLNKFSLNNLKDIYFLEEYDYVYGQDDDVVIFRKGNIFQTKNIVFPVTGNISEKQMYSEFVNVTLKKYSDKTSLMDPDKLEDICVGNYFLTKALYRRYFEANKLIYSNENLTKMIVREERGSAVNAWYLDCIIMKLAISFFGQVPYKHSNFPSILGNKFIKDRNCRLTKETVLFHYGSGKKEEMYSLLEKNVLPRLAKENQMSIEKEGLSSISRQYYKNLKV